MACVWFKKVHALNWNERYRECFFPRKYLSRIFAFLQINKSSIKLFFQTQLILYAFCFNLYIFTFFFLRELKDARSHTIVLWEYEKVYLPSLWKELRWMIYYSTDLDLASPFLAFSLSLSSNHWLTGVPSSFTPQVYFHSDFMISRHR